MRLSSTRTLRAGIAAALLTAGLGVATAQPASAACGWSYTPAANGDGSGIMKASANGWNLKSAPYADCDNVGKVSGGERVWYHCWDFNSYDNMWVYVRVAGTNKHGWISTDNIRDEIPYRDDNGDGVVAFEQC
ncbi:uncharacterized protein YgiM (DUF1202 family) [Actinoplanes campanulatus]|uniref:Uncharacterized protein YgiM (DUF1202 family) n=1 Tax=Actinoplanes campanulatus TaxID=113559 RepID=A0A7W5ARC0_9ACTN|nr:hypothetical protein [Actinoplanes campanulatus]MBB3101028.1 uncharacterized protein YgiM (DUF1202 family) [Actinoplanes campanulatus]GGN49293.1 hypothetical protein GCM10010109_87190 [Actinoplanes campanulatus]GID41882.1 hypothetical protein Aca09nite_83880 [Actinoplanes campanulatus]